VKSVAALPGLGQMAERFDRRPCSKFEECTQQSGGK
jgi:hypothetical protein